MPSGTPSIEVCSWIKARVWELDWRSERFSPVERRMREEREYRRGRGGHVELYKKKYAWVGFPHQTSSTTLPTTTPCSHFRTRSRAIARLEAVGS